MYYIRRERRDFQPTEFIFEPLHILNGVPQNAVSAISLFYMALDLALIEQRIFIHQIAGATI